MNLTQHQISLVFSDEEHQIRLVFADEAHQMWPFCFVFRACLKTLRSGEDDIEEHYSRLMSIILNLVIQAGGSCHRTFRRDGDIHARLVNIPRPPP